MKNIIIHTNNILNSSCINNKKFPTNSDKVIESCRLVMKCWKQFHEGYLEFPDVLQIKCDKHRGEVDFNTTLDIRITIKIFVYSYKVSDLEEAFKYVSVNVSPMSFATVILSVPKDNRNQINISQLLPLWNYLATKVFDHKIWRLGISDCNMNQLEELCKLSETIPSINQQHSSAACSIKQDMKDFANHNEIELLIHNDDNPVVNPIKLNDMLNPGFPDYQWTPKWVVKYSTIDGSRSVIKSLGYIVHATVDENA